MKEEEQWGDIFDRLDKELFERYRSLIKHNMGTYWQEKLYNNLETWKDLENATNMLACPAFIKEGARISIQEVQDTLKSLKRKMIADSIKRNNTLTATS